MKNIVQFFKEVNSELLKVVWPNVDDWIGSTIIMLVLVFIFSLYLGFVDFGLAKLAHLVFIHFAS